MRVSPAILAVAIAIAPSAALARGFAMPNDVSGGAVNGRNGAGAYNRNTGNAAVYNKNTGTATTYNRNANTATQYHSNTTSTYHPSGGGYNGPNSAGAYNRNTGNAAVYNKNTGTATTYNRSTNTATQYHNYSGYSNYRYSGGRYYVTNPRGYSTWGWHGGVVWAPTATYWGGGFWGAFAAGALVGTAIIRASTPSYPTSYAVVQSSPGFTLLNSYGLRQVPCGPNLVVINYSGSVICAAPNGTVAPGNYSVNLSTLTIVSM
ncbi:MAG TPA: hypothetical protein VGP41_08185 [Candidatus Lustribacter sp.]|jgi:hypothetical protein|nr:hypothetical protein [Candidatus Lustribacter sp.]